MLSILIPTYNYSALPLVTEIKNQCKKSEIEYEIIVLDDGSTDINSLDENEKINDLKNCFFRKNKKNLGRSSTRNFLAQYAAYENLLFLDVDTIPVNEHFLKNYSTYLNGDYQVVYGGIKYQDLKPKSNELLRWIYGRKREALNVNKRNQNIYLSFLTLNFLIKKDVFKTVKFNNSIPNLRHEDSLFAYNLSQHKVNIKHIDNPVFHLGLESSERFLEKSEESVVGLRFLIDSKLIDCNYIKLSGTYCRLEKYNLTKPYTTVFSFFEPFVKKNLNGYNPSLFLFDLYRLYYYCIKSQIKNK